jgi:hypothetical protein
VQTPHLTSDATPRKSRRRGHFAAVLLLLAGAPPLAADQVLLANGHRLEGRVEAAGEGQIRVIVDEGQSVVVDLAQVRERIPADAPLDLFARRLAKIPAGDRDAYVECAHWAEEIGIRRAALGAWREVMRIDPHHAGARNRLGYALHRNRWVLREELEAAGWVLHRGTWMLPEEIAAQRRAEGSAELDALLADAAHDNRFVREDAMRRILSLSDPDLLPALLERLADPDPLRRMLAGRALANLGFESAAPHLYAALLAEPRPEVRAAWCAALRSLGRSEIAAWLAGDLADPGDDPVRRHALLAIAEACPASAAIPALIGWLADPAWGPPANRLLATLLAAPERSEEEWRRHWAAVGSRAAEDLGAGWIR